MIRVGDVCEIGYNGETYNFVKYHHQVGHPKKSWWTIKLKVESSLFFDMTKNKIMSSDKKNGYNLMLINKKPYEIGKDIQKNKLFLAKFKYNNINWHGYPANHYIQKDRPEEEVYSKLEDSGIDLSIIRKLKKGQKL